MNYEIPIMLEKSSTMRFRNSNPASIHFIDPEDSNYYQHYIKASSVQIETTLNPGGILLQNAPFPRSFYSECEHTPEAVVRFPTLSSAVLNILNHHMAQRNSNLVNTQWEGLKKLRELRSNGTLRSVGSFLRCLPELR